MHIPRQIGCLVICLLISNGFVHADLNSSATIAAFSSESIQSGNDDAHFKAFKVSKTDLERILSSYISVSKDVWADSYSHVAGGTRSGTAILSNGFSIKWMVFPGGLALIKYDDGKEVYLASVPPVIKR